MKKDKVYVKTVVEFRPDGVMLPLEIRWDDGRRYAVERVVDVSLSPSDTIGEDDKYTILVNGVQKFLYFEHFDKFVDRTRNIGRWFVRTKSGR